eukprot:TRINITY_DN10180_c0_g1_i1.p1 TRINITY_DN10180_c0_g1~~TRINITY_DN10180_c0_g1_i1.p1  ORF type:complete len:73 (+),score=2.20 TRINITY_DN10180_c0_g1_i1:298-516(+)
MRGCAGILGLPFVLYRSGFVLGLCLLAITGVVTDFTIRLAVKCALVIGVTTYEGLCNRTFGKPGFYVICVLI